MTPETSLQITIMDALRLRKDEARHALHIPNEGKRSKAGGGILKRMGLTPGASDILIPAYRRGWIGLWIELKAGRNKPTDAQEQFQRDMTACGYLCDWCNSYQQAMSLIDAYMDGEMLRPGVFMYQPVQQDVTG